MNIQFGDYAIRLWRIEDAPSIARYANNSKIARYLRDLFPHPYALKDAEGFISKVMNLVPPTVFAIADSNEAIGSIGLMIGMDVHRRTAELGYWLAEPFWGRGIMSRAVELLTDYAFEEYNLNRIYAEPYSTNPASIRVLEKSGFHLEGVMRANVIKAGKTLDQCLYAKLRPGL